jgi:hypothetical protein
MTRKLTALFLVVASGCASLPQDPTYGGEYFYNFENAYLTPDGKNEEWCLHGDMSRAELPAQGPSGRWGTSHLIVRGKLGPEGHFGQLGMCERVLTVTSIVKVTDMRGREAAP